jgi:cellulose biosynthesis protein BcsQ
MSRGPLLIAAGLPELAREAEASGAFEGVTTAESVAGLIRVFKTVKGSGPGGKVLPRDVVMIIADSLYEDEPQVPLTEMLRKLTGAGFHVVIVSTTARGADLQRQFPKAGLLPVPVRTNDLLYAVGAFGFTLPPVPERPAPGATADSSAKPAPQGGWGSPQGGAPTSGNTPSTDSTQSTASAARAVVPGSGWGTAAEVAPVPAQPAASAPAHSYAPSPAPQTYPSAPAPRPAAQPGASSSGRPALFPQAGQQETAPTGWGGQQGPVARQGAYTSAPTPAARRGFVITVASAKGGVGKSSLTLNLGAFLGMRLRSLGKTVCVIDSSFQQADAGKYLDVFKPNINTIANDPSYMTRERILEGLVTKPEYNLSVLLGPATPDEGNPLNINSMLYSEILDLLKFHFDYLIVDTPVAEKYHDIFSNFALKRADYIVVPVAPSFPTLHNNDNWLQHSVTLPRHAGGAGLDPAQIGIVLNREEDGIGCSVDDVRMTMARWNFLGAIPETKEWKLANNRNELVAPKNYAELNQAFATVLYAATGEPALMHNVEPPARRGGLGGIIDRLRGRDA